MIQGSPEWYEIRRGKITASRFGVVVNGGVDGWNTYLEEVRYGWTADFQSEGMQWGIRNERGARSTYELVTGAEVTEVGFLIHPEFPNVGGSPDGLVGDDGMIEIKCPHNPDVHKFALRYGVPLEHIPQIQGNLWIAGRSWCDFISFDPRETKMSHRILIVRVEKCPRYHRRIDMRIGKFREILAAGRYAVQSDFTINPFEDDIPELF
jgi:hypothetical protein